MKRKKLILMRKKFWLIVVIAGALTIRLFQLNADIPRLNADEMSFAYNAYSLLKTGKDEWGRQFPLIFQAFGDYKLPTYGYILLPFVAVFNLSPLAVRLPSALFGLVSVLAIYWLAKLVHRSKRVPIFAAAVMAFSAWPLHLSRMAFESNVALTFFILGMVFLIKFLKKERFKYFLLTAIFWGLTWYTYIAYRLIVALIWLIFGWLVFKKSKYRRSFILASLTLMLILIPLLPHLFESSGQARLKQVSLFTNEGIAAEVIENRTISFLQGPKALTKISPLFFNKYQVFIKRFLNNYLGFLSPAFLFIHGGKIEYLLGNMPLFYLWCLPFYIIGFIFLMRQTKLIYRLLQIGLLVAPIPSALVGDPQIIRGSAALPFIGLIIAIGADQIFNWLEKKQIKLVAIMSMAAIGVYSLLSFLISYFYIYPFKYDNAFYQVPKELALRLKQEENRMDQIYIRDKFTTPHIYLAFYQQIDPDWYQKNIQRPGEDKFGFFHPVKMGKYVFTNLELTTFLCDKDYQNILFVSDHSEEFTAGWTYYNFSEVHIQGTIYDVDKIRQGLMRENKLLEFCLQAEQVINNSR